MKQNIMCCEPGRIERCRSVRQDERRRKLKVTGRRKRYDGLVGCKRKRLKCIKKGLKDNFLDNVGNIQEIIEKHAYQIMCMK
jgi:hypothetical protein